MALHKFLEQLIEEHFPGGTAKNHPLENFIKSVNESYLLNDKYQESEAAHFNTSEPEWKRLNEELSNKYESKKQSIEKLKRSVRKLDPSVDTKFRDKGDDLHVIADWMTSQISERKNIEKELNRTVNLLTVLLTNLHSGILVEDENGKVLFTNQFFCDIFNAGAEPENLTGQDYSKKNEFNKHLYKDPEGFVRRIDEILKDKKKVLSEELQMADGQYLERDFIPIYIHNHYKGHLWEYRNITDRKKDDNDLRYLNNTQEAILNGTNYGIIFTDISGTIKAFNKGAERMLGYRAHEMIDKESPDIFHDKEEILQRAEDLSKELSEPINSDFEVFIAKPRKGILETREWIYVRKNGQKFPVSLTVCSIKNAADEITGFLAIARDISEQKQAEKALKLSEEKYKSIIEKSTDIIYKTNKVGYFTFVNPVAEMITGFSNLELTNMHFSELIRDDYKRAAKDFYKQQVFEKKPTTYFEFPIVTKQKKERWIGQSVQFTQLDDTNFELTALAIDITEKKIHEKTIRLQDEKYRNIIAHMNMGIVEVDKNEVIRYSNQSFCEASGYTHEEIIGKSILDLLIMEEDREVVSEKSKQRLAGISDIYEVQIKNKKGEIRWWMVSGAPNYDETGNHTGSIGISLDVTERKILEEELKISKQKAEESSKAKESFLANMSHEIRTPLNAIIGMIRELSHENLTETQKMYLQNTSTASQHLYSILNNILDVSKIEAGEFNLDKQHFNMDVILNDVTNIMRNKAGEKNLFLNVSIANAVKKTFIGDPVRIKQILLNLVGNAIKFTEKGGITIKCDLDSETPLEQTLQLSIIDTGIGMDVSYLKNIFTKFSQEDISTSRKYGGTGLGMAITRELIQLMNGNIEVASEKNKGTSIHIRIPFAVGDDSKIVKEEVLLQNSEGTDKIKVLLTEDNEFNRLVATKTLNRHNCTVTEAINGADAIEKLKAETFDVILMDLQMPVLDGMQATKVIRNDMSITTPIIALSANAFKNEIDQCMKIGMNDYVTKPFEEKQLLEVILKSIKISKMDLHVPAVQPEAKKLYDLAKLKELCGDDKAYLEKMIEIFIEQSSSSMKQIREAMTSGDLQTVFQVSHKIKPSIDGLSIDCLKTEIREIEKDSKAGIYSDKLADLVDYADNVLKEVINDLGKEEF
jgi:PAS domain S-box-containing protein